MPSQIWSRPRAYAVVFLVLVADALLGAAERLRGRPRVFLGALAIIRPVVKLAERVAYGRR